MRQSIPISLAVAGVMNLPMFAGAIRGCVLETRFLSSRHAPLRLYIDRNVQLEQVAL